MSKISTYEVVPVPKLADKLIGTSVGGEIEDATYNFTLQELLELFLPNIPANNLQGVLDYGNTATQDINLFGTITTTNLDVTGAANLFITYLNEETHIVGGVYDSEDSVGTSGQVLTSTGEGVAWVTLPPIFTPNLQQVLTVGNTSTIGIVLDATLEALNVDTDEAVINTNITIDGTITDGNAEVGAPGQVLSSTSTGVEWVDLPVYTAISPLLFNSVTGVFSIQQASNVQGGYLSASDWVTFDGKQPAGNYITALTGEASASGPGAANTILSNAAVISKVLTGFNPTAGTINASDSILTAFGKAQSQINALVGGVQYKGTWNASTNVPTLQSSVGVQGNYYIVSVAGNTNLNGITDWQVGDWAIFSESTWQKVDNTESVTSVNGFTGAVSLTTDNIPEGSTNLYYLDSRARGALSFAAGSGAYNNVTGVITIPTNNNQILNGAGYITLASLSASAPLAYNNLTGGFSIQKADATHDGYLSSTDWSAFNNKQNYLGGTGLVKSTAGTITYITDNSTDWNTAYDRSIVSAAVTGTSTKTLTLTEQDGNTIQASWTDLDTGLTSVGVSMPSAFTVTNSPLTANGTIGITGAGTSLQYIDGTGALQNFPGLTGFVPYTGANQNVDLGEYGISAGYFQADLTPSGALQVGRMQWNSTDGTMDLRLLGNNVTLQIGEENVTRVVNKSGIDLLEENYQVVRLRKVAEGGAQGQRIAVVLAQGNSENNSTEVLGLVTETILANQEGFITCFGEVKEINTTGSLQGETWTDGDILYLSNTVAGGLTNVRPVAPNHSVTVGYVSYAHAVHGKIYMAIDTGYELGELHNVYAPSPTANQSIYWNTTNSRYELNTIGGILGYTPANAATTLTINGTTYDLSANRTWSVGTVTSVAALTIGTAGTDLSSTVANPTTTPVITLNVPTASAANRGALSAADWSTFNTKVGGVTASSPLASSGGQTPNITIQQASGSQDGYLSSTDWTTFNNKQAAGNYITSLTGEATASGPGAAAVTLNNASVTAKVLTGVNITGGTIQATDTMLTAFGKLQNQINGLVGGSIYQGTWNASTNTPALASGVGTKGYYYIVSVAGTTNLDGITDWFVGDWAIFDGTAWQQVDNTDAVVSVNGQTGAVSLTTDNIPEGATNQYFTNARSRAALSFAAGSGAYNSTTGLITIPTNTNQLTNGASFITLTSLSGTAPIVYSNTTGAISITQAGTASNGYLSSTDWNTFNNKAPSVSGGYLPLSGGTMTGPINLLASQFYEPSSVFGLNASNSDIIGLNGLYFNDLSDNPWEGINWYNTSTTWDSLWSASGTLYYTPNRTNNTTGTNYTVWTTQNLPNPIIGSGTAEYVPKFTASGTIADSAIRNQGIYVAMNGAIDSSGMLTLYNDTVFGLQFINYGTGGTTWQVGPTNNAYGAGGGKFIFSYGASSTNSILTIMQSSRNVSIGTTADISKLYVEGAHTIGYGIISASSSNAAYLHLSSSSSTATDVGVRYAKSNVEKWLMGMVGGASATDYTFRLTGAGLLNNVFNVDIATGLTTYNYNVTINTSTPTITLNDTADAGAEVAIRVNGEDFEIIEPEDTNKVWFKLNDATEDGYVFGSKIWTAANFSISGAANRVAFYTASGTLTTLSYSNYFQWDNTASVFSVSGPNADVYTSVLGKNATIADGDAVRTRFGDNGGGFLGHVGYLRTTSTDRGMQIRSMDNIYLEVNQASSTIRALSLATSGAATFTSSVTNTSGKILNVGATNNNGISYTNFNNGVYSALNEATPSEGVGMWSDNQGNGSIGSLYNNVASSLNLVVRGSSSTGGKVALKIQGTGASIFYGSVYTNDGFYPYYNSTSIYSEFVHNTSGGALNLKRQSDGAVNTLLRAYGESYIGALGYNVAVGSNSAPVQFYVNGAHTGGRGMVELNSSNDCIIAFRKGSGTAGLRLQDSAGGEQWFVGTNNSGEFNILEAFDYAKTRFYIQNTSGNVGINTATPTLSQSGGGLHLNYVNASNTNLGFRMTAGVGAWAYQEFYTNTTARFIMGYRDADGLFHLNPGTSLASDVGFGMNGDGRISMGANNYTGLLTINGSHPSGYGMINLESSNSCLIALNSSSSYDVRIRYKYQGADQWLVGLYDNTSFKWQSTIMAMSLTQSGTLTAAADVVAYGSPSDMSLKTNINPLENALDKVLKLKGVSYDWKESTQEYQMVGLRNDIGFIAQQVQEVIPELVRKNDNGLLSLRDRGLTALLVEAVKEQQRKIETQDGIINELKSKLDGFTSKWTA